jgi:flagellar basal body rod protein FlgG
MNISIQQAASSIQAYEQWHETIAGNLSAASVPGYKATQFSMVAENINGQHQEALAASSAIMKGYQMPGAMRRLDFTAGPLKHTETPTDIAIKGDGFFEIELPGGELGYTRDGEFHINDLGELVTKQGYPVLGDNGAPITFQQDTGLNFTIGHNGQVTENGVFDGQILRVVRVADTSGLQDAGGGLFTIADPNTAQPTPLNEDEIALQQFHLEQSNVSTIHEMTQMIQAMRSSELNHQVIRHYDQRLGKTIADLGQPL